VPIEIAGVEKVHPMGRLAGRAGRTVTIRDGLVVER
jgi:hypothetical protein